ncbi:cytochrome P450 [Hyaloscypha hepaticicola]|uniref:Cytochrome P450 n=1 Tax=Hyaloscypha hepaticicola TaxID=2082293 RepID=A0A2J6PR65_9HELO|nr:cytochrome P450 [Hyaloscypha hepaticicola]
MGVVNGKKSDRICLVVYRRFFHPLAKIPGPFWASITYYYIVKYNLFSERSQFYLQVEKLHQKYGPVIRISPNEIHLNDPDNYEKTAAFGTTNNALHRARRAAINPVFSRKAVLQLEDVIQAKTKKLIHRMEDLLTEGKPVDLHHGYRALSVDIVTDYSFDNCYNQLDAPSFGADFFDMTEELTLRGWVLQAFPILGPISNLRCVKEISAVKASIDSGRSTSTRKTIFHQLLDPAATPGHVDPSVEDLTDEAFTIIAAAADTTSHAMAILTYHVVSNPTIYRSLTLELKTAFHSHDHDHLDYTTLEKLPYLSAVIKEGLRISYGTPGRLPRTINTPTATFNGYAVPKGTVVGMSTYLMHRNPNLFPDPDAFDPCRWLNPVTAKRLEKCLVYFSRGSTQCVGMHLAYLQLYVGIGTIFRTFENLRIFETTKEDLEFDDFFAAGFPKG